MPSTDDALDENRRFYDPLWTDVKLQSPEHFNTWPLLSALAATAPRRLEVGAGMRPRLPLARTHFVDVSRTAMRALRERGGVASTGEITALPYADRAFDLLCAFDIVEHVADDARALDEIARVLRPGGTFVLSVPLYMDAWTFFDDLVGHRRRYEPAALLTLLTTHGFELRESAAYGMQPRSELLLKLGMWCLEHHRTHAMNLYNRFFMPLALRFQKPLRFAPGVVSDPHVDEVVLVCGRRRTPPIAV